MALPSTGPLSIGNIQTEFGGVNPASLSEYYRNGPYTTANNSGIPTDGTIGMSSFRGAVRALTVEYQVIGAGGAGGHGRFNGYDTTRAPSGGASSIAGAAITNITAAGGLGGLDAYYSPNPAYAESGQASDYGAGGAGGVNTQSELVNPGGNAPSTSYGAGGGGAGGDRSSTFDSSGGAGGGGNAGTYLTGSWLLVPGTQLVVSIGAKGTDDGNGSSPGGAGANGYARIRKDGGAWTVFTSGGTYVV
jgi:hypothetical protein